MLLATKHSSSYYLNFVIATSEDLSNLENLGFGIKEHQNASAGGMSKTAKALLMRRMGFVISRGKIRKKSKENFEEVVYTFLRKWRALLVPATICYLHF